MRNTLVVINEFGEIGLDHQLLIHSDEQAVVEMSSGCLCCTLRGDLSRTLQRVLDAQAAKGKPAPERVVIETTGLADPAPLSNIAKNLVLLVRGWIARGARAPLVRPRLLLNILLDHAQGGASDTSRKVAWTPQRVLPVGGLHQFRV